ncbi:MAG TPA: gamma-glutamyl-gamma-aminobutyrate hydrolase family protein, partial [Solirubrobacterales bacterium]|nr:gamma-glutamyl-gamma-aminobutyrate hydrolase family protein [Solirubrobacterales bacterium]
DRFELAVARCADRREIPILAICRGTQALNVARGGSLIQHLPAVSEEIAHRQASPGNETSHTIDVEPGSRLAAALGDDEVEVHDELDVNSFHHQAIERLGEGLKITARAPDGTIEAIEDPSRPFLIGVQWHAETLVHRTYEAALFRHFVEASRLSPVAA